MDSPAVFRKMASMMHNDLDIIDTTKEDRIALMSGAVSREDISELISFLDRLLSEKIDDYVLRKIWSKSGADFRFRDMGYLRELLSGVRDRLVARMKAGKSSKSPH